MWHFTLCCGIGKKKNGNKLDRDIKNQKSRKITTKLKFSIPVPINSYQTIIKNATHRSACKPFQPAIDMGVTVVLFGFWSLCFCHLTASVCFWYLSSRLCSLMGSCCRESWNFSWLNSEKSQKLTAVAYFHSNQFMQQRSFFLIYKPTVKLNSLLYCI